MSYLCSPSLQNKVHRENHEISYGFSVFSGCFRFKRQVAPRFLHLAEGIVRIREAERFLTLHNDIVYYVFVWCNFDVLYLLYVLALRDVYKYS